MSSGLLSIRDLFLGANKGSVKLSAKRQPLLTGGLPTNIGALGSPTARKGSRPCTRLFLPPDPFEELGSQNHDSNDRRPYVQSQNQNRNQTAPLYNVVLLNDDDHSYDYVIEMLQRLFCFSEQQAYHHALEVDMTQRTVLITCSLEEAEFGRDQILSYGPDPRSLTAKVRCQRSSNPPLINDDCRI